MRWKCFDKLFVSAAVLAALCTHANAATIQRGNLVVVRAGTGTAALSSAATATFLNEYTRLGAPVQSIALPVAASGPQLALTLSGSATSEGFLALSTTGDYLTLGGYNSVPGTATPNNLANNRVVGRVALNGTVDTSTNLQDSTGNIRSVVSDNGTRFWATSSSGGMRYTTFGTVAASTQLNTAAPTNMRVANIFNSQLYTSAASTTFQGVATVGSGLPTTSGQTPVALSGFPTATGPSSYDYFFANSNTLYVADDAGLTGMGTGGLQKWVKTGSTWSKVYTLKTGLTAGLRGLAGNVSDNGIAVLYATTADSTSAVAGNKLVTIEDLVSNNTLLPHSFLTLATAPGNTAFRGVELVIPEPASASLLIVAGLAFIGARRRGLRS